MPIFSDSFYVLGALLGVASVYLAPYSIKIKTTDRKNGMKNGSIIIFPDAASILIDESTLKLYGETTINNVLSMLKIEISKVLKAEKWTIIIPKDKISLKEKNSSPNFYDAKSQFITRNIDARLDPLQMNNIPDDRTEYKEIPSHLFSATNSQQEKTKKNLHKFCKGIECLDASNDNKYIHLPRQSTFINTNSHKQAKYVILGENTLEQLETFTADSDYSVITVENDNIQISLKNSKSSLNRLFVGVKSFLGFKKNIRKKSNSLKTNYNKSKYKNRIRYHST